MKRRNSSSNTLHSIQRMLFIQRVIKAIVWCSSTRDKKAKEVAKRHRESVMRRTSSLKTTTMVKISHQSLKTNLQEMKRKIASQLWRNLWLVSKMLTFSRSSVATLIVRQCPNFRVNTKDCLKVLPWLRIIIINNHKLHNWDPKIMSWEFPPHLSFSQPLEHHPLTTFNTETAQRLNFSNITPMSKI